MNRLLRLGWKWLSERVEARPSSPLPGHNVWTNSLLPSSSQQSSTPPSPQGLSFRSSTIILCHASGWHCQLILSQTECFLPPFSANLPFSAHLMFLFRWPFQTCNWPHPIFLTPHPLFPLRKPSLASCLPVPGCVWLVWSQWLCPCCVPVGTHLHPPPLPLAVHIHPAGPSSDFASALMVSPDLFFYLCIFAFYHPFRNITKYCRLFKWFMFIRSSRLIRLLILKLLLICLLSFRHRKGNDNEGKKRYPNSRIQKESQHSIVETRCFWYSASIHLLGKYPNYPLGIPLSIFSCCMSRSDLPTLNKEWAYDRGQPRPERELHFPGHSYWFRDGMYFWLNQWKLAPGSC